MDRNNELANILSAELTLLTKDILQNIHQKDLKSLYKATRQLQEKMAAIMVLKDQMDTSELMEILKLRKAEETKTRKLVEQKQEEVVQETMPEDNNKKEAVKPELVQTEKIPEKPEKKEPEINPYKQAGKMRFVPKGQKSTSQSQQPPKSSLHIKKMNIGLNDKISFIKHLFEGDHEFYTNFIERLNAFENYEDALRYINQEIKPQYDDWEGKDEYEFRLLQLLELKFA